VELTKENLGRAPGRIRSPCAAMKIGLELVSPQKGAKTCGGDIGGQQPAAGKAPVITIE